ncbi:MFS transporter [Streptomyces sp. LP11]|uniref:MFS transporter n=1 Tax=Streptomyces pyxinicus TaxID=2970331 RepID=A0ABT2BCN0_9ACTN|nr:alpha/beta fold hydrolase [Streptomyces sp. LP11]MCS0606279.1 MFS transporter [Streptomyces sp. LP11]
MLNRPVSFFVAGATGAATLTAASAPSPLYPVYQRLWGFSAFTLTLVFAVYVFALLAALLTVGSLSDRVGRRPVASGALVLLALGMLLFAIATGFGGLMAARVVQGFAVGAAAGTTTAMIMDSAPNPRSGSIVSSAVPALGIAIGAILAGALMEFAPRPRQLVFWILAAAYLVLAALVWLVPERARSEPATRASVWRSLLPSAGLPQATRPAFFALVPSIGATWALAGLYLSLGSSILGTVLDVHSHFVVGIVLGVFFAAGMAGTVVSAVLPPRLREWFGHGALTVGVLVTIAAMLMSASPLYVAGSVVAGLGFGAAFRFTVNALGEAAPAARRGQVYATMYIVSYLAFSVPALAAGLAVERFGLKPTAVAYGVLDVALVLLAAAAGTVRASRRAGADELRPDASPALASRTFSTPRQTTHYLECGPADGPLMIFLHGWPGIGLLWRAQMDAFAADGWHCVAPDLRGYGGSSAPEATDAYTVSEVVADMAELHDHLGGETAIWVGHDWGSIVAGALAAHEPARCRGVVLTSWAYFPDANSLATLVPLVDRTLYPADRYPDGQWDYYRYYTTHFEAAITDLDADRAATLASVYRPGSPAAIGEVSPTATVTRDGGRFGAAHRAAPTPADPALWPPADFDALVRAFTAHGFRGPCAWYTNDDANIAYARKAPDGGRLSQPVLFVNGEWDAICTITGNRQGDPMRAACSDLTVTRLPAGHWLPLERKTEHIQAIRTWLRSKNLDGAVSKGSSRAA